MNLDKCYQILIRGLEYLSVSLMVSVVAITVAQVFFRYVLNASICWGEEVLGFLLVWVTFCGSALAMHEKGHIGIDLLEPFIPERFKPFVQAAVNAAIILFLVIFTWASSLLTAKLASNYAVSVEISMGVIYSILPLSGALMIITVARDLLLFAKQPKTIR